YKHETGDFGGHSRFWAFFILNVQEKSAIFYCNFMDTKMKETIEYKILNRIYGNRRGWIFSPHDFAGLGDRSTIDSALHRFEQKGTIRRIIRGIYYFPRTSRL